MPRIGDAGDMENYQIPGSNFNFQGARLTRLGATEYTLVTVAVDVTGSTAGFSKELRDMLVAAVESCKKSPHSDNLLARTILFSTKFGRDGVSEIHGFKPLADIDPQVDYQDFSPAGMTPLFDAVYSAVGAMVEYGDRLTKNDYRTNGIVFVITDGNDNESTATAMMIRDKIAQVVQGEKLESLVTILIGINAANYRRQLDTFSQEAGLTHYIDMGDVTPQKLAKLEGFVSQSVSSQAQARGTGGPSQNIAATI